MRKKILLGKFGKSILFKGSNSMIGGDKQPVLLFTHLAKQFPDIDFYMLGRSDLKRVRPPKKSTSLLDTFGIEDTSDIPENIINMWDDFKSSEHDPVWFTVEKYKDVKFDGGIFFSGPCGSSNVPGVNVKVEDGVTKTKVIDQAKKYVGPMVNFLNHHQYLNHVWICEDPKYAYLKARDLVNSPLYVLSQYNETFQRTQIESIENPGNIIKVPEEHRYSGVENIFMMGEEKVDITTLEKDMLMTLILNEGKGRGPDVEKWVLNFPQAKDVKISGQWSEEWVEKYPNNFIAVPLKDMEDIMFRTKYTYINPIMKDWVTSKFIKMLHYGIIPFMSPTYDTQKNLKVPEFLRCKTPEEMWKKIDALEANPTKYKELLNIMSGLLKEEYYNGEFFTNMFTEVFKDFKIL
jgi:hypothetical protein